jgi:hypothetical protein
MATINRVIKTELDRTTFMRLAEARPLPFTITLTDGAHRTTDQNRLQRKWMLEIAEQLGDMTPEEVRGYCKLTIGVPILRSQNEAFRAKYDAVVRPLSYAQKLAIMSEPLDMPVTRIMTTKQKTEYLDGIHRHFSEQGIVLTIPGDSPHRVSSAPSPSTRANGQPGRHTVSAGPSERETA